MRAQGWHTTEAAAVPASCMTLAQVLSVLRGVYARPQHMAIPSAAPTEAPSSVEQKDYQACVKHKRCSHPPHRCACVLMWAVLLCAEL